MRRGLLYMANLIFNERNMKKLFNKKLPALLLVLTTLSCMLTACVDAPANSDSSSQPANSQQTTAQMEDVNINLGNGLFITDIGGYTGVYMEDGSDEIVSGVLMMVVTNTGDQTLQYAKISLESGEIDGNFEVSTLPAGESVVLLETSRMAYDKNTSYTTAVAENVAFFPQEPSLMEDIVKLQILDGVINVTNISDTDIDGEIVVYYKNSASDLYYGGITYRSRVTGGLKAGEVRQVVGSHVSESGTAVMFVNII